jgi:hypothetical protein
MEVEIVGEGDRGISGNMDEKEGEKLGGWGLGLMWVGLVRKAEATIMNK